MYLTTVIIVVTCIIIWKRYRRTKCNIPGPMDLPVIGSNHRLVPISKCHLNLDQLCQKYGPVVHMTTINGPTIILSDYESIYEVLVKQGMVCAHRKYPFRGNFCMGKTGIIGAICPDAKWKALRKLSHSHLKQYGGGISDLEVVIQDIGEDMLVELAENCDQPFDPRMAVYNAALNVIASLIIGVKLDSDNSLLKQLRLYEELFMKYNYPISAARYLLLDVCPFLRHPWYKPYQELVDFNKLGSDIWEQIKEFNSTNPDKGSLSRTLIEKLDKPGTIYNEEDAYQAVLNILLAGMTTTSSAFYGAINVLAHRPDIQKRIQDEAELALKPNQPVSYSDREKLPYAFAFQLETLRFISTTGLGGSHTNDEEITVKGYTIPKGSYLLTLFYRLHHDAEFWDEPEKVKPERFLDDEGRVVAVDHPNRRHLMPFGAGPRVCLAENLAMARLFIWIVSMLRRFRITPAPGNLVSSVDPKSFTFDGIIRSDPYKVVFARNN